MEIDTNEMYVQCVTDQRRKVLSQNQYCKNTCGNMVGKECDKGCQKHLMDSPELDFIFLKNRLINDKYFNITCFIKETFTFINLYPTKSMSKVIPTSELTAKEKQVVQLIFAGYKNTEILKKLSISNSTLKTHINRIYQKIGDEFKLLRPSVN